MAAARTRLNERAQKYWGEKHKKMLTRDFEQTVTTPDDQRWVCTIKIEGVVVATSVEHRNQKDANEEASLRALGWMSENGYR
jgi:Double-stranded RNA binding motif